MTRISSILAALGLLVVSIVGGALVSGGLAGDAVVTRALPEREQAIPVIGPSDGALGATPASADGGGGGGAGGDASDDEVPVSDPVGVVEPYVPADDGDPSTLRFIDPCAAVEGECDGIGSTVLGFHEAPPFEILGVSGGGDRCTERGVEARVIGDPFLIRSTTPAEFTVTARDRNGDTKTVRVSTPPNEVDDFTARYDDDPGTHTDPSFLDERVSTCFGILFPNRSTQWDLVVEGRTGDQTDTYEYAWDVVATGGRPPVRIDDPRPPYEHQLHVVVPAKSGNSGKVVVDLASNSGGATGDACRAREGLSTSAVSSALIPGQPGSPTRAIARRELTAPDYPYDEVYDHRFDHTFSDLAPGHRYDLCIWWLGPPGRGVEERVVYPVFTPQRYTVFFRVARVDFTHARSPSSIEISTFAGACRFSLPRAEAARHHVYDPAYVPTSATSGEQPCNHSRRLEPLPGSLISFPSFDPLLRVEVTRGETTLADYLHAPLSPCPVGGRACDPSEDFTEDYVVSLGSVTTGLCGSSFGTCDPPTERVGTITFRLRFRSSGHEGGRYWEIGEPTTFEAPEDEES
ncbi:MAG: hypothetical protein FJW86_11735 [Actinobacteria bacterium]|nr:hypothetical protein [Actinomycetota bacterium]